ncbi:MAG: hypothetical protein EHM13_13255 [Acidobacteria bacterium]|nr:MAG: hypothetical protein EHM13_13255 [Acidobacteriota bacterium]
MLGERQRSIRNAVSEGRLTQEQADAMVERMTSQLDGRLNGTAPMGRGRGMGFHRGPGPAVANKR